ncbi:MAG: Hsp20/alpha crystallin family protein [Myxococcota bacterium]
MARYSPQRSWAGLPRGGFDELRREMDALLGRFGAAQPSGRRGVFPPVNLYENDEAFVLTAELPGVSPSEIELSLEGNTLTLRGERQIDRGGDGTNAHRLERQGGRFRRAVELPVAVDPEKVEAVHRNGVLMLRLPKPEQAQPRTIPVQTA